MFVLFIAFKQHTSLNFVLIFNMKQYLALVLLLTFISTAETFSYIAIKRLIPNKKKFNWFWWSSIIILYVGFYITRAFSTNYIRNWYVNIFAIILITKFAIALFFIISEIIRKSKSNLKTPTPEVDLSRREFSSKMALGLASVPFFSLHWGLFRTAYNFKVHETTIKIPNLPKAFKNFKIVQISDIHTGSLQSHHQLQKAIDLVLEQNPDIICFTGDLVNNRTDEVYPYLCDLKKLQAPYGVLSILGNHDYGDYETWNSPAEKHQNLLAMHHVHKHLGWNLLLNQHTHIEKEGERIYFLGVENWGANLHFPKYGKLNDAYEGLKTDAIKILLSHDPSHFDTEVTSNYKDIQLTLSGHTHGFQFGIEIPGYVKWSPSQYIYKQWAGLYKKGNQQIYVNRGLGCLGYMGRIGIKPEITVITLS